MALIGAPAAPRYVSPFAQEARGQSLAAQARGFTAPPPRPPAAPRSAFGNVVSEHGQGGGWGAQPAPPTPFDFNAALQAYLAPSQQLLNAQGGANAGGRDAAYSSLIARYGQVPDASVLGQFGINPSQETRDLAQQATQSGLSTTAQLAQAYRQTQAGDAAAAAARGLGHSGFVGQFTNQNLQGYEQQRAQAVDALLSQLGQARSTYEQQQAALRQQGATDTQNALQMLIARINAGQIG